MATKCNDGNSESNDEGSPSSTRRDLIALRAVLRAKPELFVDITGEPRIELPLARGGPNRRSSPWPLRHGRVRAEIAEFAFHETGQVLFDQEINRILSVLEGKAWKDQRIDIDLKQALDEEPLVEALFIFLHQHETEGRFQGPCSKLLPALTKLGRKSGVDIRSKAWPKGAAQLSFRLGQLEPVLAKCGITVTRGRQAGGARYVKLESNFAGDGDPKGTSRASSVDNDHHPKPLRNLNSRDVGSEAIFDRIQTSK